MTTPKCDLCGCAVDPEKCAYAGGPCRFICPSCAEIVHVWEEKKKAHHAWVKAWRRKGKEDAEKKG